MPQIMTDPMTKPVETLNMLLSTSIVCVSPGLFGFSKLIVTIMATIAKKVIVMRSRNGYSGNPPFVCMGKSFNTAVIGIVKRAPANAAPAVVRFQNIPNKNIANTPGEKKPTYS